MLYKLLRNVTIILTLGLNAAQAAEYESGIYMRGDVGASMFTSKDLNKAAGIFPLADIALGYRHDLFRVELDAQYKQKSYNATFGVVTGSLKLQQISGFLNAYYDFYTPSDFTPYLMAGAGFLYIKSDASGVSSVTSQEFAWNIGAGSIIEISEEVSLTLGYKYLKARPISTAIGQLDISSHEVALGILYSF